MEFLHAAGLPPPPGCPVCKKPLPVLIFRFVPSAAVDNTGWRSILPPWLLCATRDLLRPQMRGVIKANIFINMFLPRSS